MFKHEMLKHRKIKTLAQDHSREQASERLEGFTLKKTMQTPGLTTSGQVVTVGRRLNMALLKALICGVGVI